MTSQAAPGTISQSCPSQHAPGAKNHKSHRTRAVDGSCNLSKGSQGRKQPLPLRAPHTRPVENGFSFGRGQTPRAACVTDIRWKQPWAVSEPVTSADALLLSRQDPRGVNDAYAVQDRVGQLGTHEPAQEQEPGEREVRTRPSLLSMLHGHLCFLSRSKEFTGGFLSSCFQGWPEKRTCSLNWNPTSRLKPTRVSTFLTLAFPPEFRSSAFKLLTC